MGVEDGVVRFEACMLMAGVGRGGLFPTFGLTCMRLAVAAPGALRFLSELNHLRGGAQPLRVCRGRSRAQQESD